MRRTKVGGSEVAALFQCQPAYAPSIFRLFHIKRGRVEEDVEVDERALIGIEIESGIARAIAHKRRWKITPGPYAIDDIEPGMGASLDFLIDYATPEDQQELHTPLSGPGCLQIKNVDFLVWRDNWLNDEPPRHILLQHQQEMAASGCQWGAVGALVGGSTLVVKLYLPRPRIADEIRRRIGAFWADVEHDREPTVDGSEQTYRALRELQAPERRDLDMSDDLEADEDALLLDTNRAAARAATEAASLARNRLLAKVRDVDLAFTRHHRIKISKSGSISVKLNTKE